MKRQKVIVNISSAQTIPNYLFIREMASNGDTLWFISSQDYSNRVDWIENTLKNMSPDQTYTIVRTVFSNKDDETSWTSMQKQIGKNIDPSKVYIVNLTGGTKYMEFAIHDLMAKLPNVSFYYIHHPFNYILSVDKESAILPIKYRVGISEYFLLHNRKAENYGIKPHLPEYTDKFIAHYAHFTEEDWNIIELIRTGKDPKDKKAGYRDRVINLSTIEDTPGDDEKRRPAIPGLNAFLDRYGFPVKDNKLDKSDTVYLTGGWFEEYVYNFISQKVIPQDITLGLKVDTKNGNDLDVVFTKGNKLYVIECKTGFAKEVMLKEIVYKASAIGSMLRGITVSSYIFTMQDAGDNQEKYAGICKNMNITYVGRESFLNEDEMDSLAQNIINSSHD